MNIVRHSVSKLIACPFVAWPLLLMKKPKTIKYFFTWVRHITPPPTSPLTHPLPWITLETHEWLYNFLTKNMTIFEWGSGASTIYLARRVKQLISIEHDTFWYTKIQGALQRHSITNCTYMLVPPTPSKISTSKLYQSSSPSYEGMSFEQYCKTIASFPDNMFDLIVIDGRARVSCLFHAQSKVKRGGYILFDNSEREEYKTALNTLTNFRRINFFGPAYYSVGFWQTSILQRT